MPRVLTNNTTLAYAVEATPGVLPGTPGWKQLEPNDINDLGAQISTIVRNPISSKRQRQKGAISDLDSGASYEADLTQEQLEDFAESFMFSTYDGPAAVTVQSDSTLEATASGFDVAAMPAAVPEGSLVYARGWINQDNNGIKVVGSGGTTTTIPVTGNVAETPGAGVNAGVEVAGYRGDSGDLEIDADGNLISTTLDFTTLNLTQGQFIHIGGVESANRFGDAANYGPARVILIAANKLTLDRKSQAYVVDDGTGVEVDILFGRFIRNVPVDDARFQEKTLQFEAGYINLEAGGAAGYEYSKGNYCNEFNFNLPLTDKATVNCGFIGSDTEAPTSTRKNDGITRLSPTKTSAFSTVADFMRLTVNQVDETGLTSDFKSASLNITNNVSAEKVLGFFGSKYTNVGNIGVTFESQVIFTNSAVVAAVRNNETLSMHFGMRNSDGGFIGDIPACTIGGGNRNFPTDESVTLDTTIEAFGDAALGYVFALSMFPVLPTIN